jgi:AcrR family transcriptional regulator
VDTPSARSEPNSGRPLIWLRPERGNRGPTRAHNRESIVGIAIALADAEGLSALSMRSVAAALGTGAGSLYRYLSSREDLLDLMNDAVVSELRPYPEADDDWLGSMLLVGRRQLALHRRHPWLLDLAPRPTGIGPESLAWFDACLQILEPVPCSVTAKFEAIALMTGVVNLVARSEGVPRSSPFDGHDLTGHPHLVSALSQPTGPPPEQDLFERTLRVLLTGLLVDDSSKADQPRG